MALLNPILHLIGYISDSKTLSDISQGLMRTESSFEGVLSQSMKDIYQSYKKNIESLNPDTKIKFDQNAAKISLGKIDENLINSQNDLIPYITKAYNEAVFIYPNQINKTDYLQIYDTMAKEAINTFWSIVSNHDKLINALNLKSTQTITDNISKIEENQNSSLESLNLILQKISNLSISMGLPNFDASNETATPLSQSIDNKSLVNPFSLVRAEDFNHNYEKLADLFQSFPDWNTVQSRTNNVFIVGGRGTGKSMILRRMSIQTTISDYIIRKGSNIKLKDIEEDYFGIYIKLIRGTFDQYESSGTIPTDQTNLLAQHELNIKILDAFKDAIIWLIEKKSIDLKASEIKSLTNDLSILLCNNTCDSFNELDINIKNEQKSIHKYFRDATFGLNISYTGNATNSTYFVSELSRIFKTYFVSESQEYRLILLIDEYEALSTIQQIAINNIIKNRLPDVTIKLAMRKESVKSRETFTSGEPIQEPRDFNTLMIDYENSSAEKYSILLKGICAKRLKESGYSETNIEKYLTSVNIYELVEKSKVDEELSLLFNSGNRSNSRMNNEFIKKYETTALLRIFSSKNKLYPYFGYENYKMLSFGIVSNFLELCKYTFYFAASKQQDLITNPSIPIKIQSHAVYYVSEKLFNQIDGNVQEVGPILTAFLTKIATLIRRKLLKHNSETECNKISIINYQNSEKNYKLLPKVLSKANTWSVINFIPDNKSMGVKNEFTPKMHEFIINRIYCPHLGIPPRSRWTIKIPFEDLEGLLGDKSDKFFKKISTTISDDNFNDKQNMLFQ